MLPIVELRGAVPFGMGAMQLPMIPVLIVSIIGNLLPVPFIILFIRRLFEWMKAKSRRLGRLAEKLEARGKSKGAMLVKYEALGLFILVAIPLPGTGAWTGALVAAMMDLRLKNAIPTISLGVIAAGIIMAVFSDVFFVWHG
ncbi:MAG: small multi-drug export protein [Clostridia bacterium]|nr:small multi-drug export protein [Clostridia bacterium]